MRRVEHTNSLQEKRILEQQLLTEQEIHELGLQALVPWLESHNFKIDKNQNELFILILFALSYLLYFLREGFILSMIYPFVISYYNVVILQSIRNKDFRTISLFMIFIGWMASGSGLFVALTNMIFIVPVVILLAIFKVLSKEYSLNNKEIKYV